MNKKLCALLVSLVLVLAGIPANAAPEQIVLIDTLSGDWNKGFVFSPWGCAGSGSGEMFVTYYDGGTNGGFETAFFRFDSFVLKKGESVRVEAVTTGGVAPFVYEWDVYYQPFAREVRTYSGELHEISLNSYLDFTPRKDGRYIFMVRIEDSKGNAVQFDSDAVPTDKNGEITEIINEVAAAALETGSEYDTVCYIREWLMNNADYSTAPANYEADSIFLNGCGVCSGYASAFNMLCNACGVESFSVHGYASAQPISGKEHSWNCVKIDNDWYFTDITHDDNSPRTDGFFLMTSATCEQSYCFGKSAGAFSACGGACLPPRCNATIYAESYDDDPTATAIRIKCGDEFPTSIEFAVGGSCRVVGATTPNCSRHPAKIWETSNAKVATVDSCGIITAHAVGHCIITLTCGELSASVEIIVK